MNVSTGTNVQPDERVSLTLPAEVRIVVCASSPAEGKEIMEKIFGDGEWIEAVIMKGGMRFAVKVTS